MGDSITYLYFHYIYTISAMRAPPESCSSVKYRGKSLTYFIQNEPGLELTPL